MQNIPEDFIIRSKGKSTRVSFSMMSITCRLFSQRQFSEMQYETYLPVSEDVLKAFVSCVYDLVINPNSVKTKITPDNVHYLSLLAEEFQCGPLSREIEEYIKVQKETKAASAEFNVTKLEDAIRNQEHEIVSHFESLLASDFANALEVLARVPSTRIPISCIYRIIEKSLEKNPESLNESVLCDFVLARLAEEDENEACALVQFLHLDKLHWGQVRKLIGLEKLRGWYDETFPVRFLDELMSKMDTRMSDIERDGRSRFEALESTLMERITGLQAENERLRDGIREREEEMKRHVDERMGAAEAKMNTRMSEMERELRGQFEKLQAALMERITGLQVENERLKNDLREREEEMRKNVEQRMSAGEAKVNQVADSTTALIKQAEKAVSEKTSDPMEGLPKLLIQDLPEEIEMNFLVQMLSPYQVKGIHLRKGRSVGDRWYAVADDENTKKALQELNYTKIDGVPILMSWWDKQIDCIARERAHGRQVLITNLDKSVEESQLREALARFGEITRCKIRKFDKFTLNRGRVWFRRQEDANRCIRDPNLAINGVPIKACPGGLHARYWFLYLEQRRRRALQMMQDDQGGDQTT